MNRSPPQTGSFLIAAGCDINNPIGSDDVAWPAYHIQLGGSIPSGFPPRNHKSIII